VNLLLLEESDRLAGALFRVSGPRAKHIREVLRAEPGRELRVGLLEGPLGTGLVRSSERDRVDLECAFEAAVPERPRLDLVLAIPRPKALARLLPDLASFGVDRLVLLRTWRVEKPYLASHVLDPAVYRSLLRQGLAQGRSTREPRVTVERLFRPFAEDRAPDLCAGATAVVAHPPVEREVSALRVEREARVVLAIGPEGGFIPFEVDLLARAGFTPVTLGPRPLRVEIACVALLAQIDLLRRLTSPAP